MSGFVTDLSRYGGRPFFELTATKARYWHRFCDPGCWAVGPADVVLRHAVPRGFELLYDGGNYAHVTGPGIAEGKTRHLYAAIAERDVAEVDDR